MAFGKIRNAGLIPGKTVPLVLNMLPGEPVVNVEHLGTSNTSFINDQVARASHHKAVTRTASTGAPMSELERERVDRENREFIIKHVIRKLEAKHDDGRDATDADIPEFVQSLPPDVVTTILVFAFNAENFRERVIESAPKALAEK